MAETLVRKAFSGECGRLTWWKAMAIVIAVYFGYSMLLLRVYSTEYPGFTFLNPFIDHSIWKELLVGSPILLVALWVGGGATTRRMRSLGANVWIGWPAIVGSVVVGDLILALLDKGEITFTSRGLALLAVASAELLLFGPVIWLGAFPHRKSAVTATPPPLVK